MARTAAARASDAAEDLLPFDEGAMLSTAFEATSVALMAVDRDFIIRKVNPATERLLAGNAEAFRKAYPQVDFHDLVGVSIDVFHSHPAHQRRLLSSPLRESHKAEITVGDLRFSLTIASVIDDDGEYVASLLEWNNVSDIRRAEGMLAAIDKENLARDETRQV